MILSALGGEDIPINDDFSAAWIVLVAVTAAMACFVVLGKKKYLA
jgi:hypothetical protein